MEDVGVNRIGIYPEWNVKLKNAKEAVDDNKIGIYPEWNVKY